MKTGISSIPEAIKDYKTGKMLIVIDDEDRENEGDLVLAAEKTTPAKINFMAKHGRGLICLPLLSKRLDELNIPDMVNSNTSSFHTAFSVSIDVKKGATTGISAFDRARTILAAINKKTKPSDLARPGHIFPLRYKDGGVLKRAGQTEASVDLALLSGLYPAGVICEIMKEDGSMARLPDLQKFSKRFGIKIITVADLIKHRRQTELLVKRSVETTIPNKYGVWRVIAYENLIDGDFPIALVLGDITGKKDVLVRVHSECLTGDILGSYRCDCGEQLDRSMGIIAESKSGVLLYMRQEGRGIGLINKLKAYSLQDKGYDTVQANVELGFKPDLRTYGIGAQILADLKLSTIKLMTNNPTKVVGLEGYGIKITERIPIEIKANHKNKNYLKTKKEKLGHLLNGI